jgi:hypothetical protein
LPLLHADFDEGVRSVDAQMRGRDVSTLLADAVE